MNLFGKTVLATASICLLTPLANADSFRTNYIEEKAYRIGNERMLVTDIWDRSYEIQLEEGCKVFGDDVPVRFDSRGYLIGASRFDRLKSELDSCLIKDVNRIDRAQFAAIVEEEPVRQFALLD